MMLARRSPIPMQNTFADSDLAERLPPTRGRVEANAPLADQTWFRVGGPAEVLYKPYDAEDLAYFMAHLDDDIPVTILGLASNTLVRDGGVPGVVVKLGPQFSNIRVDGVMVTAGAGAVDLNVARAAQAAGVTGLEFLCGIPGTIGGGLRMNAGAYGREFRDIVIEAEVIDRHGRLQRLGLTELGFTYRHSAVPEDWVFLAATLQGERGDPLQIEKRMKEIQEQRAATQPIREKTGGSTFANPDDDPQQRKSWQLIEQAGCRGLKIGGAQVSEKHCNFLINAGKATAADIEALGEEVRKRVQEKFGVTLRWEIRRIGVAVTELV
jgi:UDP-N-acetylmuramate dehydrogenase